MKLSGVWNIRCWYLIVFCKILLISTLIVVLIICIKCKCLQWCWSVPGMSDWSVVTTQWLGQVREITMYQEVLTIEQIGMLSSYVCVFIIIHCSSGIYQDSFSQFCNAEGSCSSAQVGPILRTFGQNPSEAEIQVGGWSFQLGKATQALTNLAHFSRRQIQFHNKQNRQTSNVVVS